MASMSNEHPTILRPAAMARVSTQDPAAYYAYLQGLSSRNQTDLIQARLTDAIRMFELAINIDAGFIEAYSELIRIHAAYYYNGDWTERRQTTALELLKQVQKLDTNHPAVRLASFFYMYHIEDDYELAIEQLPTDYKSSPSRVEFCDALGLVKQAQGKFDEALALFVDVFSSVQAEANARTDLTIIRANLSLANEGALARSNATLARDIASTLRAMRRHEEADRWFKLATEMAPTDHKTLRQRALNALSLQGKQSTHGNVTLAARRILAESPLGEDSKQLHEVLLLLDLYEAAEASPRTALASYAKVCERIWAMPERSGVPRKGSRTFFREALALERLGHRDQAVSLVQASRVDLEELVRANNDFPYFLSLLGIAYAYLGLRDAALFAGQQAAEQVSNDHYSGPRLLERLAVIYALLGEHDQAIELLERLLVTSYRNPIDSIKLRFDPIWDRLRDHPRFRSLIE